MTEKRFKAYGNTFIAIDDNVEDKTYYLDEDVDRIVDLLNSLCDELGKTQNELRQEQAKTMELQMKIDYLCEKYDYKGEPL